MVSMMFWLLKDADVSIAMGSGSDAAKQISQFVVIKGNYQQW